MPKKLEYLVLKVYADLFVHQGGLSEREINMPGPAQVGAISKAQKKQKDSKVSKY